MIWNYNPPYKTGVLWKFETIKREKIRDMYLGAISHVYYDDRGDRLLHASVDRVTVLQLPSSTEKALKIGSTISLSGIVTSNIVNYSGSKYYYVGFERGKIDKFLIDTKEFTTFGRFSEKSLVGHTSWVYVLKIDKSGKYLFSCSNDKTILICDLVCDKAI